MKKIYFLRFLIVSCVLFLFYVPLFFLLLKAFVQNGQWTSEWFRQLFEDPSFWSALENSFIVATISSTLSVILALMAVLRKRPIPFLEQWMLVSLSFPEIVLALSSLSLFVLMKWPLGLTTMVIGHTTLTLSFAYFVLSRQMKKMDPAILEAAEDLGASEATRLWEIQIPWLKGSIVSSYFLCFLLSLDDFLISFFVSGVGQDTLPIKLFSMLKIGVTPTINALSFLILSFSFLMLAVSYPFLRSFRKKAYE